MTRLAGWGLVAVVVMLGCEAKPSHTRRKDSSDDDDRKPTSSQRSTSTIGSAAPTQSAPPSASPTSPPPREEYPSKSAKKPDGTPCDTLTAQACLQSKDCVLQAPDPKLHGPYVCRPAEAPCEGGIAQADPGFEANCNTRGATGKPPQIGGGCNLRPAECFCPDARTKVEPDPASPEGRLAGGVSCACGGGPFRQCLRGK